jgi:hypothetical protein
MYPIVILLSCILGANGPTSRVDIINANSTAIIAVFTALTFFVFLYQIKISHDAERAWLVIEDYTKPEHLEWREVRPDIYPKEVFSWKIKNTGRTPGRILDIRLRFHCIQDLKQLPAKANYGNGKCTMLITIPTDGAIIPQNETAEISTYFEGPDGEPSAPTQQQMNAVRAGNAFLVSCGSIRYKDAFQRRHETRFCYVYHLNMPTQANGYIEGWFSPGGPTEYNKVN